MFIKRRKQNSASLPGIIIVALLALAVCALSACGSSGGSGGAIGDDASNGDGAGGGSGKHTLKIVATTFPTYDWVRNILGDNPGNAEVTLLLDDGVDQHSYQPTTDDILKITNCDLFIYVGGESDEWVQSALKDAADKGPEMISLLDAMGDKVKEEETLEGMQADDDHDIDSHSDDSGEEPAEHEADEHVWLSLKNAQHLVDAIATSIAKQDPDNAEAYTDNASAYNEKLAALDKEYRKVTDGAKTKMLLFGDRFPFRYMTDDYGLDYYAAFAGCSAETEASFETVSFLSKKVDEFSLKYVMTIEGSDNKLAETIIQNTKTKDQNILSMDSLQSTTSKDVEQGKTYIDSMKKNLDILKKALN